jgi:N-acetylmuramic acid 6-phosphate etherase
LTSLGRTATCVAHDMSDTSIIRSTDFLKISDQFKLGGLTTEMSHPVTTNLSETARADIAAALDLLFDVDSDVLRKYEEFANSGRAQQIKEAVLRSLKNGGKLFFTGCGSTGRLSIQLVSIWRDFWQQQRSGELKTSAGAEDFEHRAFSVMAGGDFALIKAVEGFEDFTEFGKKQIADLGVSNKDVVFAITEGGETSFVIGTAWQGLEVGAKVYFVYNNPDDVLCEQVKRSREVIQEPRIEKINLTTGPMAITGSTRMQATTIQLCVILTVLEMVLRDLLKQLAPTAPSLDSAGVPQAFLRHLKTAHQTLKSKGLRSELAKLVSLEESVYRSTHKNNYYANHFGIDVLTDTTERSPTFCTPPFRKFDDRSATESWAFLFLPLADTTEAWEHIIKRKPKCVEWTESEIRQLVPEDKFARTYETVRKISYPELMRFKIGLDGLTNRKLGQGDSAVAIVSEKEKSSLLSADGFHRKQLEAARKAGARTGLIYFGAPESLKEISTFLQQWDKDCVAVLVPVPRTDFLLDGVTRATVKMLLNSLSTCTMVRLGRVMGNYMIWVVPSNLKLIDRSTRYIQRLTGMEYQPANNLLFEVIEYVEPRMKADQAYPPVVGVSVMRVRHQLDNQTAEQRLLSELS